MPRSKRNLRVNAFPITAGLFFLLVIVTTSVLLGTLLPSSNSVVVDLQLPFNRSSNPFSCPASIDLVLDAGPQEFGGICIAWYDNTTLYYFKNVGGQGNMIALTFDENRTTILNTSANLFASAYPGDSFTDCTFFAQNDTFVLYSGEPMIYVYSPQGVLLHSVEPTLAGPESGDSEFSTSLFYDENGQFFIDDTYADIPQSSGYRPIDIDTGVIGTTRLTTPEFVGVDIQRYTAMDRSLANNKVYVVYDFDQAYERPSAFGVLNTDTDTLEVTCIDPLNNARVASLALDHGNTLWFATGGNVGNPYLPHSIYKLNGPIEPVDERNATTFSLQCMENVNDFIGSSAVYPDVEATITGTGCYSSNIRVFTYNRTYNRIANPDTAPVMFARIIHRHEHSSQFGNRNNNTAMEAVAHYHLDNVNVSNVPPQNSTEKKRDIAYSTELGGLIRSTLTYVDRASRLEDPSRPYGFLDVAGSENYDLLTIQDRYDMFQARDETRMLLAPNATLAGVGFQQFVILETGLMGDCAVVAAENQRFVFGDSEAERWVFGYTVNSASKVCVIVSEDRSLNSLDVYEFDFPGQSIDKLTFGIWGSYYNMCFNNLNDGITPWSKCYVLERERLLNPLLGMARIFNVPTHTIVTSGAKASAQPLHQPSNNGPRGPIMQNFPCGIFVTMTGTMGGVLNLKLCKSINFDTSSIVTSDSLTTIGAYSDGSSGSCVSETQCIELTPTITLDPNRYDVNAAYRQFPNLNGGIEQLATTITINADGTGDSAILVTRFTILSNGTLSSSGGGVFVFDPTTRDEWNPSPVFTPDSVLWVGFRTLSLDNTLLLWRFTRHLYGNNGMGGTFPPITDTSQEYLRFELPTSSMTSKVQNFVSSIIPGYNSTIFVSRDHFFDFPPNGFAIVKRLIAAAYNTEQFTFTKFFAYDDCNQAAKCISSVRFSVGNLSLAS